MAEAPEISLSIVIPVYNEEASLPALFERVLAVAEGLGRPYEILFTDDGSTDGSRQLLAEFQAAHPDTVRVIVFEGNFGQHMAITAAFERVRGQVVVTLDADLQNPPEEIPKLLAEIDAGHDVVGGYRAERRDNFFRRWSSAAMNRVRARITNIEMRDQGCMLRAYTRAIVDRIAEAQESATFIPALANFYAANPTEVEVRHEARRAGRSKYRLYDLIRLNFDLVTGFSLVPLQIFTLFGMVVAALSLYLVIDLAVRRITGDPEADVTFTLFAITFFLLGVVIVGIGLVGEYVGRIYQEVRRRPRFVIREVLGEDDG